MGTDRTSVLLKLSGELIACGKTSDSPYCSADFPQKLMAQIKEIAEHTHLGIVIGAGNFFRGSQDGPRLGLPPANAHEIGMIATIMNGRILQSWMDRARIPSTLLSMVPCPTIAQELRQQSIDQARKNNNVIIFVGGSGNPFFTTDTTAVIRTLQIGATELWKATKVDGLYTKDPKKHTDATLIKQASFDEVVNKKYGVMDRTALTLAQEHNLTVRIINLFSENALVHASKDPSFGSMILPKDLL